METKQQPDREVFSRNHWSTSVVLGFLLLLGAVISLSLGRYGVPAAQVVRILLNRVIPLHKTWTDVMETVVVNIRLPRIVLACLVGGSLSAAGASYQAVFQNPMASRTFSAPRQERPSGPRWRSSPAFRRSASPSWLFCSASSR